MLENSNPKYQVYEKDFTPPDSLSKVLQIFHNTTVSSFTSPVIMKLLGPINTINSIDNDYNIA